MRKPEFLCFPLHVDSTGVENLTGRECLEVSTDRDRSQDGLDVEHRRAVERLEVRHMNLVPLDAGDRRRVEPDGVGPVGRPRGEHPRSGAGRVTSWLCRQGVAIRPMEPCDHDDLVAGGQPFQSRRRPVLHSQDCGRGVLIRLTRTVLSMPERRLDDANGSQAGVESIAVYGLHGDHSIHVRGALCGVTWGGRRINRRFSAES